MASTIIDGPEFIYGNLGNIPLGTLSANTAVPDTNPDAGPSLVFQGEGLLDPRIIFLKDKIIGYAGVVQGYVAMNFFESIRQIPSAHLANNIVNGVNAVSGTPMALAAANSVAPVTGIAVNIPYRQFSPVVNAGNVVTAPICLDFGFGFGTTVAGSANVTVGLIWDYILGMPLCIAGAGNAGGTIPLLTTVIGINTTTSVITLAAAAQASITGAAIGTGDLWGPAGPSSPGTGGYPTPQAAAPFLAAGPSLLLDSRQSMMRGIGIVGANASSTGGNFLITGVDCYGSTQTQLLSVPASNTTTAYTAKTFKYILSVTPQFTDAHPYNVGTSDVFGFCFRATLYEDMAIFYNGAWDANANGWLSAVLTQPSTNLLGDVRGTIQVSTIGTGSGSGIITSGTPTTGSQSALLPTGLRLSVMQQISLAQAIQATQANPYYLMGVTPA